MFFQQELKLLPTLTDSNSTEKLVSSLSLVTFVRLQVTIILGYDFLPKALKNCILYVIVNYTDIKLVRFSYNQERKNGI